MKNRFLLFVLFFFCAAVAAAQPNCDVRTQPVLRLMGRELDRNFKYLKKLLPPVYYLSYTYTQGETVRLEASFGELMQEETSFVSSGEVMARAGSPALDNTHALRGEYENWSVPQEIMPAPDEKSPLPFQKAWWRLTKTAAENAQKELSVAEANQRSQALVQDKSADFIFPPRSLFCHEQKPQPVDISYVKTLLRQASALIKGEDIVLSSSFSFSSAQGHRYFADSRGTRLKTPFARMRLSYAVQALGEDGLELSRSNAYDVASVEELPSAQELERDIRASLAELKTLLHAPEGEAFSAPTILKGRAAAVFVHEVMGHRLEGYRQKNADDGQTLSGKVGTQVISPLITITADPTMRQFNGRPLRGHYEYDDEGVAARPVVLVENGILKNFLMQSSPISGFPASNGHGRKEIGKRAAARMSVLRTTASQTMPYEQLEQKLVEEIKKQGKPYGFIVEDLDGGYTFTAASLPQTFKLEAKMVYKIYPDGRKEPVRGLDVVGTPLVSFNRIIAAADDDTVFDGSCGSVSGWVPQSNISPSLLFENMEVQKSRKSEDKPPVLPAPSVQKERKK